VLPFKVNFTYILDLLFTRFILNLILLIAIIILLICILLVILSLVINLNLIAILVSVVILVLVVILIRDVARVGSSIIVTIKGNILWEIPTLYLYVYF